MRQDENPLADDIAPKLDDARLARQWSAVSNGVALRPRRRLFLAMFVPAAVVALAVLVIVLVKPWRHEPVGATATTARASDVLRLPDGSRATLSSGADVAVESATRERVHLVLGAGTIDLDVTHVVSRPFVVTAAGHDVTVLGTAFVVKLEPRDGHRTLSVAVSRGRVRVVGPSGEHVLDTGQSWSARVDDDAASSSATASPAPSAPVGATASAPSSSSDIELGEPAPAPSGEPSARAIATPPVEGARELLARATEARASGRPRDAAVALDQLRKRYRNDARAGLAAFELGRLRLDALSDPAGAAEAFGDAITLSPSAPFREDAEARRVEALDALPDRARCERVRDAYLTRYPSGLHSKQMAQRCKRP